MIFLLKSLIFLKRFVAAFFVNLIWKPLRIILRFIFYKFIVKFYRLYLYLLKKAGWSSRIKSRPFHSLVNQKLVHFTVIILTVLMVSLNLTNKTQAVSSEEVVGRTFLAELVISELSDADELIEEFFDEESIISPVQQTYLDNLASIKSQPMAEMRAPDEIDLGGEGVGLIQGGSALIKPDLAATSKIKRERDKIVYYTVEGGDTISTIAAEFEVSVNTILWENNLSVYSLIRPGNQLAILPTTGITHKVARGENLSKIANKYNAEEEKIREINKLDEEGIIAVGQKLIIPGGRKVKYASYTKQSYTGLSAIRDLVSPPSASPVSGNKMNWPTQGHRISQYYSWRHYGLDIANKYGTPIYAADTGTVETVGWGTGYGNQIIIDHGGGKKTRYAHLSKVYISKGDKVDKGQTIAAMGSTGWSSGSHLHFEVIINGRKFNPLNYIK